MEPIKNTPITGTTTDVYANALDWDVTGITDKMIRLKNTHASYSLSYKLLTNVYYDDALVKTEINETTLAAGEFADFVAYKPLGRMIVQVKSYAFNYGATYQVSYGGKI